MKYAPRNFSREAIIVGRCFIRVCKDMDIYNRVKQASLADKKISSPFGSNYNNINNVFVANGKCVASAQRRSNDEYEPLVIMVNTLVQYYIEKLCGINPRKCQDIGAKIFNMAGKLIYGKAFEDEVASQPTLEDEFEAFCYAQYMHLHKKADFEGMSFDVFKRRFFEVLQKTYNDFKRR